VSRVPAEFHPLSAMVNRDSDFPVDILISIALILVQLALMRVSPHCTFAGGIERTDLDKNIRKFVSGSGNPVKAAALILGKVTKKAGL